MKHRRFFRGLIGILILVFTSRFLWGQSKVLLEADYAVFKYDSSQVFWEFYYALHQRQLTYVQNDSGGFTSFAMLQLYIYKDTTLWTRMAWKNRSTIDDTAQLNLGVDLLDRVYLLAPPGNYSATLKVQDLNKPSSVDSIRFIASIEPFSPGKVALSDVELASSIERKPEAKGNAFYKNTLMVIPNPARLFGEKTERLYYYLESYHLITGVPGNHYSIHYYVEDSNGKMVEQVSPVRLPRTKCYDSKVEFGAIGIGSLHSGTYFFHFELSDSAGKVLGSKSKKFFVSKLDNKVEKQSMVQDVAFQVLQSEFASMDGRELDQELKYAGCIFKSAEKKNYKKINNLEAKRYFIYTMWKAYDTNPETILNEFRQEYMKRVWFANENFTAMKKEGWQTDRGHVYILYGKPNYVETHPNETGLKPYEVWYYDEIQGGVLFVFGDLMGVRDYQLIHSTALGEIKNSNYLQILQGGFLY